MTRTEYEVLTPVGTVLMRTPDVEIARAFVRNRSKKVPGLHLRIEAEETTVKRSRVAVRPKRRPAPQLRVVSA
jgi:hypothetical protein